ncbi:MAG TPA: putative metalloprotease CJM1_0395 family protein [Spongiibacteraceae bacterium]|nr:putative metalloprotease CJM1_0395 family protein [Spongiibacteraceae bacterium]
MNNVGGITQSFQTLTPSYSPLGKSAAGLESPEAKDQTLPPVEETSAGDKNRNQPNQKADAVSSDKENGRGSHRQQSTGLTEAEQQQARELAATDREVHAHEAAHQAVGGTLAGAASFRFVTGPDGVRYAVGGEVPISFQTEANDPEATLRNAEQVRAAALAPAQPSAQDRNVAAQAAQVIAQAQLQIALQRVATLQAEHGSGGSAGGSAVETFNSAAGHTLAPGSLFDQRS